MKYTTALLYGSVRRERQGIKAVRYLEQQLTERGHKVLLIDPMEHVLPLLDKMYKEYEEGKAPEIMEKIAGMLREADGYVIVTGEYNHSIPPALKNMLDHFQKEYFFKPTAIAAYSVGRYGGVRSAIQLRIILGELGMVSTPIIQPFPQVSKAFNEAGEPQDDYIPKSTNRFLGEYEWYLEALKKQRDSGTPY